MQTIWLAIVVIIAILIIYYYTGRSKYTDVSNALTKMSTDLETYVSANMQSIASINAKIAQTNADGVSSLNTELISTKAQLVKEIADAIDGVKTYTTSLVSSSVDSVDSKLSSQIEDLKVNIERLQIATSVLDKLSTTSIDIANEIATKASSSDLTSIQRILAGKAESSDVQDAVSKIAFIAQTMASKEDLKQLTDMVQTKADTSALTVLQNILDKLTEDVNSINVSIHDTIDAKVDSIVVDNMMNQLSTSIAELQSKVSNSSTLEDANAIKGSITKLVDDTTANISELNSTILSKLDGYAQDITFIQSNINSLVSSLAEVKALATGKPNITDIKTLLDEKANSSDLQAAIGIINTSILSKASTEDLTSLANVVNGKASDSDLQLLKGLVNTHDTTLTNMKTIADSTIANLTTLTNVVNGKATDEDLSNLKTLVDSSMASLTNVVNGKATIDDLSNLKALVDSGIANLTNDAYSLKTMVNSNASALSALTNVVNGKATIDDLSNLKTVVDSSIANLTTIVNGKASISDLSTLKTLVDSSMAMLTSVVNGKASSSDLTTLQAMINTKANISDLSPIITYTPPATATTLTANKGYRFACTWNSGVSSDVLSSSFVSTYNPQLVGLEVFRNITMASVMSSNGSNVPSASPCIYTPYVSVWFKTDTTLVPTMGSISGDNNYFQKASPFAALAGALYPSKVGSAIFGPFVNSNAINEVVQFTAGGVYTSSFQNISGLTTGSTHTVIGCELLWYLLNAIPQLSTRFNCKIELVVDFTMNAYTYTYTPPTSPKMFSFRASKELSFTNKPFYTIGTNAVLDASNGLIVPKTGAYIGSKIKSLASSSYLPIGSAYCLENSYVCGIQTFGAPTSTDSMIAPMCCPFSQI